jgi:galactitol-specific phosphotransferase system IIB component
MGEVHVPSTMVASCGMSSVAYVVTSVCGRGVGSSTPTDRSSSPAAALGSSPSQDRSVDLLHNTILVIIQARLLIYKNYSETGYTHKLDQTTVTVRAPNMLAISIIPASAGASSSTWAPLAPQLH